MDLLVETMAQLAAEGVETSLVIAGHWEPDYVSALIGGRPELVSRIEAVGPVDDLTALFEGAALYVHLGRGEAFGISVLEAMRAGLPAVVSEWTGAREAASAVDPSFVVPLDAGAAARVVRRYFAETPALRQERADRSREVARRYTEARAYEAFRRAVFDVCEGQGSS